MAEPDMTRAAGMPRIGRADENTLWALSADGMMLVIKRRTPRGVLTTTVYREPGAGPFTIADVDYAARPVDRAESMQPGQRNSARMTRTRLGTVFTEVLRGPPTWWLPKIRVEKGGTVMAGWLRLAVAVKFERHHG